MPNYKQMYTLLFNSITDAIRILQKAQKDSEKMYIESEEPNIITFTTDSKNDDEPIN